MKTYPAPYQRVKIKTTSGQTRTAEYRDDAIVHYFRLLDCEHPKENKFCPVDNVESWEKIEPKQQL